MNPVLVFVAASAPPTAAWESDAASLAGNSQRTLRFTLSPPPTSEVTVQLDGSGLPAGASLSSSTVTVPANATEGTVQLIGDSELQDGTGVVDILPSSAIVVGEPSRVTVTTSAASEPGGGPIDGDTGLGANHRAPGESFGYVIDVSDGAYAETGIRRGILELNARRALSSTDPNHIDVSTGHNVAILLPSRTETKCIGINGGPNYDFYEKTDIASLEGVDVGIHFIGPWVAEASDSKVAAMTKVRDRDPSLSWGYGIRVADADGISVVPKGGGHTLLVNVEGSGFSGSIEFWCMDIRGGGRACIALGTAPLYVNYDNVTAETDIHFHLVQLHQDDLAFDPDPDSTSDRKGNSPFWGVSSWNIRLHIHGWYSDLPWNSEHHLYLREEPYGDKVYEYFHMDRCGGQLIQKADRSNVPASQGAVTLIGAGRTSPGTNFYRHAKFVTRGGRWTGKASAWFTQFSTHEATDMEDVVVVELATDNCHRGWPPADPYTDPIANEPFAFTNGTTAWTHDNSDRGEEQTATADHPGYQLGPVRMRGCVFYTKLPTKNLFEIRSAPNVDIEDCGFFNGPPGQAAWDTGGSYAPGSRSALGIGSRGRGGLSAPDFVGPFRWIGNCTAAHIAVLTGAPFNIPLADIAVPDFWVGTSSQNLGPASQDMTFDGMDQDTYQAGVNPRNLVITPG